MEHSFGICKHSSVIFPHRQWLLGNCSGLVIAIPADHPEGITILFELSQHTRNILLMITKISQLHSHPTNLCTLLLTNSVCYPISTIYIECAKFKWQVWISVQSHYSFSHTDLGIIVLTLSINPLRSSYLLLLMILTLFLVLVQKNAYPNLSICLLQGWMVKILIINALETLD